MTRYRFTPEQVMRVTYAMVAGDPLEGGVGIHRGAADIVDSSGVSKKQVYEAALNSDEKFFRRLVGDWNNVGRLPESTRTWVKKKAGKLRPIDVPSNVKRAVAKLIEVDLGHLVHEQGLLSERVIAFRNLNDFDDVPGAEGARVTIQDQFASTVYKLITGPDGPCAVVVDLADAYGNLTHDAVRAALRQIPDLAHADRRRVLAAIKINSRRHGKLYRSNGKGIEQGTSLSPLVMNMVVSMLFDQAGIAEVAAAYGDDIVIVGRTEAEAMGRFRQFQAAAESHGMKNVRDIGLEDEKGSQAIDTSIKPIEVISTFTVRQGEIGLVAKKLSKLRAKLAEAKVPRTPSLVRRTAASTVLSKRWMRSAGLLDSTDLSVGKSPDPERDEDHQTPDHSEALTRRGTVGGGDLRARQATRGPEDGSPTPGLDAPCGDGPEDGVDVWADADPPMRGAEAHGDVTVPYGDSTQSPFVHIAESTTLDSNARGDSPSPLTTVQSGDSSRGSVDSGATQDALPRGGRVLAVMGDPEVLNSLVSEGGFGNALKEVIVDLRGLDRTPGNIGNHLARLLDAGSLFGTVSVLIHPGEGWTASTKLLGGSADPSWERGPTWTHPNGRVLQLRKRTAPAARPNPAVDPRPPGALVEVHPLGDGVWHGVVRRGVNEAHQVVATSSFVDAYARLEATSQVIHELDDEVVAVRSTALLGAALQEGAQPKLVPLAETRRLLRSQRRWDVGRTWTTGTRVSG